MVIRSPFFIFLFLGVLAVSPLPASAQAPVGDASTELFKKTIVSLVNGDRAAEGVSGLSSNRLLAAAAQKKADDMAAKGYFSHKSPRGTSPWHWFTSVGYYYTHAGENLAVNFDDPSALERAWMASPAHRANIVRSIYAQVGVGVSHGTYLGRPATFVVQFFATPAV